MLNKTLRAVANLFCAGSIFTCAIAIGEIMKGTNGNGLEFFYFGNSIVLLVFSIYFRTFSRQRY